MLLTNFIAFQVGWLACVLGGAHGLPWAGVIIATLVCAWHVLRAPTPRLELWVLALALLVGLLFETAMVAIGLIAYPPGQFALAGVPLWMLALWPLFGTTLNLSLRWLHNRLLLSALFGAIGGPLSYYAGARLGAITFASPAIALAAVSVGWASLMPVLVWVARRRDGFVALPLRRSTP